MYALNCLFALFTGLASSAPGQLPVPLPRTFPGPIAGIRVLGAETGKDLPDAQVRFRTHKFGNWMACWPVRFGDSAEVPAEPEKDSRPVRVTRRADGIFVPHWCLRLHVIVVFPPGPLGCFLHFDHFAVIDAGAPGHRSAWLMFYPASPMEPGWSEESPSAWCRLTEDGILEFRLSKELPPAALQPNAQGN
jgi:hypothetical protein